MERGIYAQGWYPRQHNYHPSRPPRRLKMLDDFVDYRATMLTWPALGGGGISLPYLEQEAEGPIPARFRFYGYVSDREFNEACSAQGIKAFSVIFLVQGWEFPAELSEDDDEVLSLNELRGVGRRAWLGLREFTQNTYPRLWKPFESYFPDGLRNSDAEVVTDLWEEGCSRDVHGQALRADWVECPDREHVCHLMDTNNPVWREYVKAVIRIHVDAGVDGIQFDEVDGPTVALQYGGCFCKDCMKGFRGYLEGSPAQTMPEDVARAVAGGQFHYGRWLLERGQDRIDPERPDFLAREYVRYLRGQNAANVHELVTYARRYAAEQGRDLLVSANVFDGAPWHVPLIPDVDIPVPEQRYTMFRQPSWLRYVAAVGGDKPVTVSQNPYGGVLPGLVQELNEGRAVDRYRTMMYEAAAMGVNLSVPYGAWMGSVIEDALYAPHTTTMAIQAFLADNEDLYSRTTVNDTAVLYSMESNLVHEALWHLTPSARSAPRSEPECRGTSFYAAADALTRQTQPLDVVVLHDGQLRADDVTADRLGRYRHVVVPGCRDLTPSQAGALSGYLDAGGTVTVVGDLAVPEEPEAAEAILSRPGARATSAADLAFDLPGGAQVVLEHGPADAAVNLQRTAAGHPALHVVSYDYDQEADCTPTCRDVRVSVRLPEPVGTARVLAPGHGVHEVPVTRTEPDTYTFTIPALDCYAVAELGR